MKATIELPKPLGSKTYEENKRVKQVVDRKIDSAESAIAFVSKMFSKSDIKTSKNLVDNLKSLSGDKRLNFLRVICNRINGLEEKIDRSEIRTGHSIALVIAPKYGIDDFTGLFDSVLQNFDQNGASNSAAMIFVLLNFYHILPDGNGRTSRLLYEIFNETEYNNESFNNMKYNVASRPDGLNEVMSKIAEVAIQELFVDAHLVENMGLAEKESRELAKMLTGSIDRSNDYTGSTDWERYPQHTGDTRRLELLALILDYFNQDFYKNSNSEPSLDICSLSYLQRIKDKDLPTEIGTTDYQYYRDIFKLFMTKMVSFFNTNSKHSELVQKLKEILESPGNQRLISIN